MINLADKIKSIKILDQLDLDNKKLIMIVLISAVVFYIDFNFIFKPQVKWLKKSSAQAAKAKKDLVNFWTFLNAYAGCSGYQKFQYFIGKNLILVLIEKESEYPGKYRRFYQIVSFF